MDPYQTIYRIFGLGLLMSIPLIQCKEIHELMTEAEIFDVFHSTPETVPEYEVVSIEHSLHKRSAPKDFRLKFRAFNKDVDIYLNPNDGVLVGEDTPVWVTQHHPYRVHYRRLEKGIIKEVIGVYQSLPGRAALVVRALDDQSMIFDGVVEDLTVRSVPNRLENTMYSVDSKHDFPSIRLMKATKNHIVFKANKDQTKSPELESFAGLSMDQLVDPTFVNTLDLDEMTVNKFENLSKQMNIIKPNDDDKEIIFPTIIVTTDFNVAMKTENDSEYHEQLIYQLAFWNAVDLRFRHLSNPKVRLRIAGFVIGSARNATPYLNENAVNGLIDVNPAIDDMSLYWYHMSFGPYFLPKSYHIVATATNLDLLGKTPTGERTFFAGMALRSIRSSCNNMDGFYPTMVFKDDQSFGGINTAVHELAHVLGADHDGQSKNDCNANDGYLMSPKFSRTVNNPKWSKCSLETLSAVLRNIDCIDYPQNEYPPGKPVDKILPGTLKTAEEQCQARGYDWACEMTPSICRRLRCWNSGFMSFFHTFNSCQESWSAAEGTECAPDQVCLDGECQSLYPPDSQQSR